MDIPVQRSERRRLLSRKIIERARSGRGGGVGTDWVERFKLTERLAERPRRRRGLALLALIGFMMLCAAAGAGGSMLIWNGQDSSRMNLDQARTVLSDPAADPNLRRSAAATVFAFGDAALKALLESSNDDDASVGQAVSVWLRKLDRTLHGRD